MAGVFKGLTIEISAKTSELDAALRKADTQAKNLERELRNVERAMKLDGGGTDRATRKMELLAQSIENAEEKMRALKAAESKYGDGRMSTDQWTKLQAEIEQTEADIERYRAQMQQLAIDQAVANSALGKAGETLTDLGEKLDPIGQKMQSIGTGLTLGVTVPMVAAGTASIKAAVNIDTALTGVRKTVDGTEEDYQRLKEAAIEFSKTNAVSAEQVLNAQALGAQLGFTLDELEEFSRVATGLEISTDMGLEDAATEMAQFANITGMAHDQISNYASAIVEVGNNMATTESKVSSMAQNIAAAGTQVNMTQAEIIGWSGVMSSLGIEAEKGGTAFSTFVSDISKAVSTGGDDLEAYAARAGMTADEFSEAWQQSSTDTLQALLRGIAGADDMTVALEELGVTGTRESDVLKRLAGNTDLVAQGLDLANDGWEKNTALTNEVANKNGSLAAKFEMLKNRVIAVAEQVGKPLADAMLDAIDAAQPLFEAIENGAKAFSEMSEGEQQTIIKTVAIIAALGPALGLFGKVTSSVKVLGGALTTLARGFATLDVSTGGASRQVKSFNAETGKVQSSASKANVAMGAMKGAAIGLAVAGIAVLISAIQSYLDHGGKVNTATNGLSNAMGKLGTGGAVAAFDEAGGAVKTYRQQVDEAIESHAKLAKSIDELYTDTEANGALADNYVQAIKDAKEAYENGTGSLADLQAAVDGYNSVTGSSLEITDKETGALSLSTAALDANAAAWKANARAQAAQSAYQDLYKENIAAHDAETAAIEAEAAAWDRVRAAMDRGASQGEINNLTNQANKASAAVAEATRVVEASDAALDSAEQQVQEYSQAAATAAQTTDDFRNVLSWTEDGLSEFDLMAENLGVNVDDLAAEMSAAGLQTGKLASLGTDNFSKLYRSANGDIGKIVAALKTLDDQDIDPKDVEVTDNGTIQYTKNGVKQVIDLRVPNKSFSVNVDDNATWKLEQILSLANRLSNKVISVFTGGGNAAGGISQSPIRKFAQGAIVSGIADRPTLTNVGLVGEAGAEAIIPLTNAHYVGPFAGAVADSVAEKIAGSIDTSESARIVTAWLSRNMPRIIAESTPVMGERDFGRAVRRAK